MDQPVEMDKLPVYRTTVTARRETKKEWFRRNLADPKAVARVKPRSVQMTRWMARTGMLTDVRP